MLEHNVTGGENNIGLDRDLNPGPKEYHSCTLPLSYRTTCQLASRYITKYLYMATYTPSKIRIQSRILETEKHGEMFSRCQSSSQSKCGLSHVGRQMLEHNVTGGEKNIGLDQDSNPGPQEYRSCSLPLSYRNTCRFASRYITKYLYTATYIPSKLRCYNVVTCIAYF